MDWEGKFLEAFFRLWLEELEKRLVLSGFISHHLVKAGVLKAGVVSTVYRNGKTKTKKVYWAL